MNDDYVEVVLVLVSMLVDGWMDGWRKKRIEQEFGHYIYRTARVPIEIEKYMYFWHVKWHLSLA